MRFWDSSAIAPLLVGERSSPAIRRLFEDDPEIMAWWATDIECVSALSRLEREGRLSPAGLTVAIGRLDELAAAWHEVQPVPAVRRIAVRLLRSHPLRAADSLQLAAAVVASELDPSTLAFVTLDRRLAEVAEREGFSVTVPPEAS